MPIEVLLVQILVLVFTGALWWIARRDLASRVPPPVPPVKPADTAELEQLCATLEALVTRLTRRVEALERRPVPAASGFRELAAENAENIASVPVHSPPVLTESIMPPEPAPDPRLAPVYALLDAGVFDPVEIARQTGLGRGEVDLILSLRQRRAF